ncbi:MAG: Uma2 family endonuclease [Gemmatimonadaceae bacterium]
MLMTVDEFFVASVPDGKAELVRGELRVTPPAGAPHGTAAANLVLLLGSHVKARKLGRVFGDGFGYVLTQLPHTVRVPDVSFVHAERLPAEGIGPGLLRIAPDLAVEVLSPGESASELEEKLADYSLAGTPLIWIVDPSRRSAGVLSATAPARWLQEGDLLRGDDVIPGFVCSVAEIFDGIAR